VDAHAIRRVDAGGLAVEMLARRDEPPRDHRVAKDVLLAVDVVEIHLQRLDPLRDAALQPRPFGGGDHAGNEVERKRPLLAGQRKRDALVDESAAERVGAGGQLGRVGRRQLGVNALVGGPHGVGVVEHLVERRRVGPAFAVTVEDSVELLQRV
jgi:hypothetical protein